MPAISYQRFISSLSPFDAPEVPTIDDRVRKLSRSGREMLDDFLRYLEFREAANAAQDWR